MVNKKIFLDINIILDIIESTRKDHEQALQLGNYLLLNDYRILISEDMLTTIFYISSNKQKTLIFIKEVILEDWEIVPFGKYVIKNGLDLSLNNNLDLEDTLQCLCAKENDCEILITNDIKFYDCGISICTAKEFLKEKK
jgi:predicted nucleic acid-binding protein